MLLFDHGNTAATTGDHDLTCISKGTDRFDLYDINGLWSCDDTAEALSLLFLDKVALLYFHLSIFGRHITSDQLGRLIKGFVIRIHGNLCQDRGNGLADSTGKQLSLQGILDIIANIALAHGAADAHGCRSVINVDTAQLSHGLVDHADLRSVAVGDRKLVISLDQVSQCFGGDLYGI